MVERAQEAIARRKRLIQQASRCAKRTQEDQALILALTNQVKVELNELSNFHETSHDMRKAQRVHRVMRVEEINQYRLQEHEATAVRQEAAIADLREKNEIAQLLISRYKEHKDEEAALESEENSRLSHERRRTDCQIETSVEQRGPATSIGRGDQIVWEDASRA